nr:PD-(D/E)XK nuclease family protein [Kitasatospora azatica]
MVADQRWARHAAELTRLRASGQWLSGPSTALGVLDREAQEAAHERYLAFLLDPQATHGLGPAVLAALLRRAGRGDLTRSPAALDRSLVDRQIAGATSRPDIVVAGPGFTLVVELKIRAGEGKGQTGRQADDFAHCPDPVFVYLTPSGVAPADGRFRAVSLVDLAQDLAVALRAPLRWGGEHEKRGRAVTRDYLNALEELLGMSPVDEAAARFWLTNNQDMLTAQKAAKRLLVGLPDRAHAALSALAPKLGAGLAVARIEYTAVGELHEYQEVAVVLGHKEWLVPGRPRCGFGLGQRLERVDPDDPRWSPFVGFYCEDARLRDAVSAHFAREQWGRHWARWAHLPLTPPPGLPVLDGLAQRVVESVTAGWRADATVMESLRTAESVT